MYKTGEEAPHTGIYLFERHSFESRCKPSQDEKEELVEEGEEFPSCPVCGEEGHWRYLRAADKK